MIDADDPLGRPLTLDQAAAVAHVHISTIHRWIQSGELAPVNIQDFARRRDSPRTYVIERDVLVVESNRWRRRHAKKTLEVASGNAMRDDRA